YAVEDQGRKIAIRPHCGEQALRETHVERFLDLQRKLEEIERVDCQIVHQRNRGGDLFVARSQVLRHHAPEPAFCRGRTDVVVASRLGGVSDTGSCRGYRPPPPAPPPPPPRGPPRSRRPVPPLRPTPSPSPRRRRA